MTINTRPAPWLSVFSESGGYDCMTGAFTIKDRDGRDVTTIDLRDYGQRNCHDADLPDAINAAHPVARLIAAAPMLAALLERVTEYAAECADERDERPACIDEARSLLLMVQP